MIGCFSDKFGFTEPEIESILSAFHAENHGEIIRNWYNGYSYGGQIIYNPWSVISYIEAIPNPPGPKWLNTSSNTLVYEELDRGGLEIKRDLEILLNNEKLRYPISENITFSDIGKNPLNIWSFLFYTGYLKASDPAPDLRGRTTYLISIPNREISFAYEHFIESMYSTTDGGLDTLMRCFLGTQSIMRLEAVLQDLTLSLMSMYDLAKLPEAVFHAFVLGLLANLRSVFEIRSNVESGYGRADILMIPKIKECNSGYIIEFKSADLRSDLKKIGTDAGEQIRLKEYRTALDTAGVKEDQIMNLVIVLQGKRISVTAV